MPGGVSAIIGSFGARLGLDSTDYARGILNASAVTEIFGARFATFVSNPLLGAIQLFKDFALATKDAVVDAIDHAESMAVFGAEVATNTTFLQALKAQYDATGRSWEASKPTLKEIAGLIQEAREAGSQGAIALERLGVSLEGVTDTGDALALVIDGLAGITDESQRLNLAMQVLGSRSGPELLAVIGATNGAVDDMIARARALGLVMDQETIGTLGRLDDQLDSLNQAIAGIRQTVASAFARGLAEEIIGDPSSVENFAQAINTKLVPLAEEVGRKVGEIIGSMDQILDRAEKIANWLEKVANSKVGSTVGMGLMDGLGDILTGDAFDSSTIEGAELALTRAIYGEARGNRNFDAITAARLSRIGAGR